MFKFNSAPLQRTYIIRVPHSRALLDVEKLYTPAEKKKKKNENENETKRDDERTTLTHPDERLKRVHKSSLKELKDTLNGGMTMKEYVASKHFAGYRLQDFTPAKDFMHPVGVLRCRCRTVVSELGLTRGA